MRDYSFGMQKLLQARKIDSRGRNANSGYSESSENNSNYKSNNGTMQAQDKSRIKKTVKRPAASLAREHRCKRKGKKLAKRSDQRGY